MFVKVGVRFVRVPLEVHKAIVCTNVHHCQRRQSHRDDALRVHLDFRIWKSSLDLVHSIQISTLVVENKREWWITATRRNLRLGVPSFDVSKYMIIKEILFSPYDLTLAHPLQYHDRLIE